MLTPELPKSVRIGGLDYTIKPWGTRTARNTMAYGLCDQTTCVILLKEDLVPQKMAEVLLHEVLHAAFDNAGLNVGDGSEHEERIVNALGYQLLQVLRDNPQITDYIAKVFRPQAVPKAPTPKRKRN